MTDQVPGAASVLVGESAAMSTVRAMINRIANTEIPVLVTGPTGSGKDVVARALHAGSGRSGAYVAVNVCALGDTMFEDALFGHVRGAFTGALASAPGFLVEAHRGTLFLDEIGSLPASSQAKLLRAVETRSFRPVGARGDSRSEFRLVSATNEDLSGLVSAGRFRLDLLHRLAGITIRVPPLVQHLEDIPALVDSCLRQSGMAGRVAVESSAMMRLQEHTWPGNVRELFATLMRMVALSSDAHLTSTVAELALECIDAPIAAARHDARERLTEILLAHEWNVERAAASLGVHRTTLYRRIRRLGIVLPPTFAAMPHAGRRELIT